MIRKDVLPNGMVMLTDSIPHANSCAMGLWVKAGSRHEVYEDRGSSHFLEHMNFKGTEKRNAKDIAEALDIVGGNLNAYTSKEYTSYYGQVLGEDVELCVDVLSDIFLNSKYDVGDIEKEKSVVLEEVKLYEDAPDELVIDLLNKATWRDHSLGIPILGDVESVNSFTREQIVNYHSKMYSPKNTVFALAGKIDHDEAFEMVNKYFNDYYGVGQEYPVNDEEPIFNNDSIEIQKNIEQEHIMIGIPGLSYFDPDYYTWIVINEALGGGASSRLFQKIREDMGLSYSVFSFTNSYSNCGMGAIYAACAQGNGDVIVDECYKELAAIRKNGLLDRELALIKNQIKGSMLMGMDSINSRLSRLGRNELHFGRVIDQSEIVDNIMSVNNDMVIKVANELFQPDRFSHARIGGANG